MSFRMNLLRLAICIFLMIPVALARPLHAQAAGKDFVVVIDAGHGGHDAGAPGAVTNEKTVNLAVANLLGARLKKEPGIKVVFTRTDDRFVTLQGRANMANKADGDLFISIHTNSVDAKSKNRTTVRGSAVYTLGLDRTDDNLAVAMRENSVMKLENDYSTTYEGFDPNSAESYIIFELSQNKHMQQSVTAAQAVAKELAATAGRKNNGVRQANFWVLLKTAMPSMLVELDFICNPTEEKFLASRSGQDKLAKAIYNGVMDYYNRVNKKPRRQDERKTTVKQPEPKASAKVSDADDDSGRIVYRIQFMTAPKQLRDGSREFKGLKNVDSYSERGMRKYTYGTYSSPAEASADLRHVKTLFPDAFVIKMKGGKRVY